MNSDNPELKAQLYGGDISDYYKKTEPCKNDNDKLIDLYNIIRKNKFGLYINKNPDTGNKPGI